MRARPSKARAVQAVPLAARLSRPSLAAVVVLICLVGLFDLETRASTEVVKGVWTVEVDVGVLVGLDEVDGRVGTCPHGTLHVPSACPG